MTETDPPELKNNALLVQLAELNNRSRWYSSQLWQVPFAYLGIAGVVLAQLSDKPKAVFASGLFLAAIFGCLVYRHMSDMQDGVARAVVHLIKLEETLHLEPTVKLMQYGRVVKIMVLLTAVVCLSAGMYLGFRQN